MCTVGALKVGNMVCGLRANGMGRAAPWFSPGALRRRAAWFVAMAACYAATACGANVVRDDLERDIQFEHAPQRIVTLLPSLTETVCALGACGRLVATDRYSNWPSQVIALPKAGGLDDAEIELIVSLKPDLVLLSRSQRITERLKDLGIPSFALNTDHYADIARNITTIGSILGVADRAAILNDTIAAEVHAIGEQARALRRGAAPAVYFEVDPTPYAAGPASFIGELLAQLGARNIVTPDLGAFPKLNPEFVVRENPDVIFIPAADAPRLPDRPGWAQIRAVREQRLCSFGSDVSDTIVRPGPRVADGMRAMADCLHRVSP
jgi:iron complex transport system substrate-binding protein